MEANEVLFYQTLFKKLSSTMSRINTVDYYYELITEVSNFSEGKTISISTVLHSIPDRNFLVICIFIFVMNLLHN